MALFTPPAMWASAPLLLDTYTGATVAYSLRKLSGAYSGAAIRLREDSGDTEADIGFDSNGDFDAAAAATHLAGAGGRIVKWYDQSGNAYDMEGVTVARQPFYTASGVNSGPSLNFDGPTTTQGMLNTGGRSTVSAMSISTFSTFAVVNGDGVPPMQAFARILTFIEYDESNDYDNTGSSVLLSSEQTSDEFWTGYYNNVQMDTIEGTVNTDEVITSIYSSTEHQMYVDGTGTGSPTSGTWVFGADAGMFTVGYNFNTINSSYSGDLSEVIGWPNDQTSNLAAITLDQQTYYGI